MVYLLDAAAYIPIGFGASLIFLAVHEIALRVRTERVSWFYRIAVLFLGLYLTVVFSLTVSPVYGFSISHIGSNVNLMPLKALSTVTSNPTNFWGNILLFVPFGMLSVLLSYKCQKFYITIFSGLGLSLLIEVLQLFGSRGTDIDDIILNTVGTMCGYFLGKLILFIAPCLGRRVGVWIEIDDKYCRKRNDAGSITVLATFVLISVFVFGFSIKTADGQQIGTSVMNNTKAEKLPNNEIVRISKDINAKNAYLWNVSSNAVLYEKGSNQQIAPASTTKMLTALTVLDYCDENDEVLVGEEIKRISKDASRAWLNVGNRLTVRQLLHAMLLPSGNDAAYTLAVFTGRKISHDENTSIDEALAKFVAAMNKKAADVGAVNSNFVSPDGYDMDGQYSTAHDLACIAKAFISSKTLKNIAGSYRISDVWLSRQEVTYLNTDELINPESPYYYKSVIGGKTGKSESAGSCLVSCADIDKKLYICVAMGSTDEGRWRDSLAMYHAIRQ